MVIAAANCFLGPIKTRDINSFGGYNFDNAKLVHASLREVTKAEQLTT
jgi:hypothetical protein